MPTSSALLPILSLIAVVALGLIITRIASCVLVYTGVAKDVARFQARSAFTGCGFTTHESESLATHPVRRKVIMALMLLGNAGIVTAMVSLFSIFSDSTAKETANPWLVLANHVALVALGLLVLLFVSLNKWLDTKIMQATGWALRRFTELDVSDYHSLLHLSEGYTVNEIQIDEGHWLRGRNLMDLRLPDEGIQVLGIHRASGRFLGTPSGHTYVRAGDTLVLYGRAVQCNELEGRRTGKRRR